MAFICGSFNNQEEDDFEVLWPSPSRKTRKHRFCCRRNKDMNNKKNPYSNRGLDKFEALLADIDHQKQKIFTQKGSQYISFVRFVYSNSNDVKPIIVKLRDPRKLHDIHKQNNFKESKSLSSLSLPNSFVCNHHDQNPSEVSPGSAVKNGVIVNNSQEAQKQVKPIKPSKNVRVFDHEWKLNMRKKLEEWWMPSYNLPLFVILVLVFLTFFGRSLAIICTSIAWYLFPTVDGSLENTMITKPKKMIKNEKLNEKDVMDVSSPKPFLSGPINVQQKRKMNKITSF